MANRVAPFIAKAMILTALLPILGSRNAYADAPTYTAVNLGTISNMDSWAYDINNAGQIVGVAQSSGSGPSRAFLYDKGTLADLGGYFGGSSAALAINDTGSIVGQAYSAYGNPTDFQLTNGIVTTIDANNARDVNTNGDFVGNTSSFSGNRAYLYSNESFTDIQSAIYGADSYANAINSHGQVVGYFLSYQSANHAYLFDHGIITDIGQILGGNSWAYDINDSGQVVGSGGQGAFLYSNGAVQFLGSWPARGINNLGEVVGGDCLYDNGDSYDLQSLLNVNEGWTGIQAFAINDYGQIVGYGYFNGVQRAILLNPVPEPASLPLLVAAILTRTWYGRRKQRDMHRPTS